ncbi:MAG TPA: hypothetical protein VGE77_11420 [Nocardioides sp.]
MTDVTATIAGAGRHVATLTTSPGLALVTPGGRHAAYGSASDLVVNAGDAAQVIADASGLPASRVLTDPTVLDRAADAARTAVRADLRRLGVRGLLTRAGREARAELEVTEHLVEKAVAVLGEAHRSLGARAS